MSKKTQPLAVRIDIELATRLDAACAARHLTENAVVEAALLLWFRAKMATTPGPVPWYFAVPPEIEQQITGAPNPGSEQNPRKYTEDELMQEWHAWANYPIGPADWMQQRVAMIEREMKRRRGGRA